MDTTVVDEYEHVSEFIFYTPTSIPGKGCDLGLFESQILSFCGCENKCDDVNTCACVGKTGKNYEAGRLTDTKLSGNGSCVECNSRCRCSASGCANRLIQFGPNPNLRIESFPHKGYGLTCGSRVEKGQFVCEYAGEVIGEQEAADRRRGDRVNYIFSLNEHGEGGVIRTIVDATCIANVGRYINHSCDPNCVVVPVRVDSVVPKLAVFSRREIDAGEEITYSYDGRVDFSAENTDFEGLTLCHCGTDKCSRYLPYNP